jgi:adenosine deaminase
VERIDHGVRSMDDPELIRYLIKERIPLTVCPLSNVKLRVFPQMKAHNIRRMLQMGVCVTINSDDPAYFGGYMNENFIAAQEGLGLTQEELVKICANSIKASFIPYEEKKSLEDELNRYSQSAD